MKKHERLVSAWFILFVSIILSIPILGVITQNKINSFFEQTYEIAFEEWVEAEQANADLIAIHRGMKDVVLSRNTTQLEAALQDIDQYDREINKHFTNMDKIHPNNLLLAEVIKAYKGWLPIRAKTIELTANGQYDQTAERTRTVGAAQLELISEKMNIFIQSKKIQAETDYQSSKEMSAALIARLFGVTFLAIILAVGISIIIRRKLSRDQALLYEEKEQLRVTFESIGDGVITTDIHRKVLNLNKAAEKFTGWKAEEAIGRPFAEVFEITNVFNGEKVKDPVEKVLDTDSVCMLENHTVLTSKDGIKKHIADSAAPIKDQNGLTIGVVMIFRDVTERKQAQDAIKESEEKYRNLFESSGAAIVYAKPDGIIITVNNFAADYLGGGQTEDYIGKSIFEIFPQNIAAEYLSRLTKAVTNEYSQQYEDLLPLRGGDKWVVSTYSRITDVDGNILGIQVVLLDTTERKKREEDIRYLSYHDALTGLYNRAFFEEEGKRLDNGHYLPLSVIMGDINGLKLTNDIFGHAEGDKLISGIANILNKCCRSKDIVARVGGDEFCILLPQTKGDIAQAICRRIYKSCEEYESGLDREKPPYLSISLGYATKTNMLESLESIMKDAEEFMYKHKLLERKNLHSSIISSIKTTLFEKSHETVEHAERLAELSKAVGQALNLTDEQLNELNLLATLHDIGKMSIDNNILTKPESLTEEEWSHIKKHPEVGYRIAQASPELISIADYILSHHEHWDGSGYPQGLSGEAIPLLSRILIVIDTYDAMTQDKPYRKAMSKDAAIAEIVKNAGTQFDPAIVKIFIEKVLEYRVQ